MHPTTPTMSNPYNPYGITPGGPSPPNPYAGKQSFLSASCLPAHSLLAKSFIVCSDICAGRCWCKPLPTCFLGGQRLPGIFGPSPGRREGLRPTCDLPPTAATIWSPRCRWIYSCAPRFTYTQMCGVYCLRSLVSG